MPKAEEKFVVVIDLETFRKSMQDADGFPWSIEDAKDFLIEEGFVERVDGWECDGARRQILRECDIISIRRL